MGDMAGLVRVGKLLSPSVSCVSVSLGCLSPLCRSELIVAGRRHLDCHVTQKTGGGGRDGARRWQACLNSCAKKNMGAGVPIAGLLFFGNRKQTMASIRNISEEKEINIAFDSSKQEQEDRTSSGLPPRRPDNAVDRQLGWYAGPKGCPLVDAAPITELHPVLDKELQNTYVSDLSWRAGQGLRRERQGRQRCFEPRKHRARPEGRRLHS